MYNYTVTFKLSVTNISICVEKKKGEVTGKHVINYYYIFFEY